MVELTDCIRTARLPSFGETQNRRWRILKQSTLICHLSVRWPSTLRWHFSPCPSLSRVQPCMARYPLVSRHARFSWETAHLGRCVGRNHRLRHKIAVKIAPCEGNCCVRLQAHRVLVTGLPLAPRREDRGRFPLSPPPHNTKWLSCCCFVQLCVFGAAADCVRA